MALFNKPSKNIVNSILLALFCITIVLYINTSANLFGGFYQWDFRAYYFGAKAYEAGLNPYSHNDNIVVNTTPYSFWDLAYPYHPVVMPFFQIFTKMPYSQALMAYLSFNLFLIFLLIFIWRQFFLVERFNYFLFFIILLFSFNGTLIKALTTGNAAIIEAAIIWLALVAFIKNRPLWFMLLIILISFMKWTPLLLMPLVFLLPDKKRNFLLFCTIMLGAALVWFWPLFFNPKMFSWFWGISNIRELGMANACSFSLITDIFEKAGAGSNQLGINITFLIWAAFIAIITTIILIKSNQKKNYTVMVFLALLAYALIVPRYKDYAYIQQIPIAYYLIAQWPGLIFFFLLNIFGANLRLPYFVSQYFTFNSLVIGWGVLIYHLSRQGEISFRKSNALLEHTVKILTPHYPVIKRSVLYVGIGIAVVFAIIISTNELLRINKYIISKNAPIMISNIVADKVVVGAGDATMNMSSDGSPIIVNHKQYKSGISAHAASEIVFKVEKKYKYFLVSVGILDTSQGKASLKFKILGDKKELFSSPVMGGIHNPIPAKIDISNVNNLTLIVDALGNIDYDQSVWLDPTLIRKD